MVFGDDEMIDVEKITGIGAWTLTERKQENGTVERIYQTPKPHEKAFLVVRDKTIEVRCDKKLSGVLKEQYESVMESRYFGRGGIEIVTSGQLDDGELEDLVRLSYNLTLDETTKE